MNIIKLDYTDRAISATREAWFNATEIAAMFGKQPYEWLRLPETERYIQALCKREAEKQADSNTGKSRITKSRFIKAKRGNAGGTWLHPKLAIAFARWCDVDFAVDDLEQAKQHATERMAAFMATIPELSGQARRVAKRFAIAAAALELAAPVTGLPVGVGMAGVKKCFDEWLEANGAGKHEDRRIIEQAEDFIAQHALGTRFMEWSDKSTNKDHAGYRKQEGEKLELWVIRRVFADEIAQSFDESKVCRVLADNGLLKYNHKNRGYQHQRKGNGWFHVLATNIELDD